MAMALPLECICPYCGYPRWGSFHIPGICPSELFEVRNIDLSAKTIEVQAEEDDGDGVAT
jgi:hypothetical protein